MQTGWRVGGQQEAGRGRSAPPQAERAVKRSKRRSGTRAGGADYRRRCHVLRGRQRDGGGCAGPSTGGAGPRPAAPRDPLERGEEHPASFRPKPQLQGPPASRSTAARGPRRAGSHGPPPMPSSHPHTDPQPPPRQTPSSSPRGAGRAEARGSTRGSGTCSAGWGAASASLRGRHGQRSALGTPGAEGIWCSLRSGIEVVQVFR